MQEIIKAVITVFCTLAVVYLACAFIAWDIAWVASADPVARALSLFGSAWLSVIALMGVFGE